MIARSKFQLIIRSQENDVVSGTMVDNKNTCSGEALLELFHGYNLKDCNQSPFHNGNNVKYKCDINELPEGGFPLTI